MLLLQMIPKYAFFPLPWSKRFYLFQVDSVPRYLQVSLIDRYDYVTKSWLMHCRKSLTGNHLHSELAQLIVPSLPFLLPGMQIQRLELQQPCEP